MWNELSMLLKAQNTLCRQLIVLGRQQEECMLQGLSQQLREVMKMQESTFSKFVQIETKKQRLLQEQSKISGVDFDEERTIAEILSVAPKREQEEMMAHREQFIQSMQELKNINQQNRTLLDNEVQFIDFNINIMTQTTADDIYAPQGQNGSVISKKKMFDQTI